MTVLNERALIEETLRGCDQAFEKLVKPYHAMMRRYALSNCKNKDLADDAVQEALIVLYCKLREYEPGTSLKAFLGRIVVNCSKSISRSEGRHHRFHTHWAPLVRQPAGTPLEELEAARTERRIREAVDQMPLKRGRVAKMRIYGFNYSEIAVSIQTSSSSARVLMHLALKHLKCVIDYEECSTRRRAKLG